MLKLNMVRGLKIGAIASALALSGLAAQAQGPHRGGPGMGMDGMEAEHMLDAADATDAQRTQVKTIMQSARADVKPLMKQEFDLHKQAEALFAAPQIDANAIESLRQQGSTVREQISKRMSQAMIAAANVLTPAQRATLAAKMAKREARMAERMKARHSTAAQ
ncbi:periplasmic heavy metal sensor [Paucibacter sp. R3-3]|uniref:Periplasmic heavy metal sensor n=1 Tax=Roseateles agri TaxID=3098619 RepID=A0ABU5DIK8_9BURK|nr:periplasmic heavy metal sensor [Paucibacter sp. R3-3]MDY0746143.1 periplasmic heavy metal sensor [Paucibacter sp. R3-3]